MRYINLFTSEKLARLGAGVCSTLWRYMDLQRSITIALCATMLALPFQSVTAEEGYLVMQYEMSLGKKPAFRQLNLSYQDNLGTTGSMGDWRPSQERMHISLYSPNPRTPGLFNQLDGKTSDDDEKTEGTVGKVVGTVLGIGILGLYVYAASECVSGLADSNQTAVEAQKTQAACSAL